jgi:hypothetical protein
MQVLDTGALETRIAGLQGFLAASHPNRSVWSAGAGAARTHAVSDSRPFSFRDFVSAGLPGEIVELLQLVL